MKKKRDPRDIDVYPKKREPKRPKQGWSYNITKFVKNEIMYPHRRKYRKRRVHWSDKIIKKPKWLKKRKRKRFPTHIVWRERFLHILMFYFDRFTMYEKYGEDPRESYKMLFILASRHICIINIKMLEQAMVYKCDYLKLFKRKIHDIDKSVFKGMHTACGFELKEQDVIFRIHSRYKKCVILLRDLTIKKKLPMFYCNVVEIKGTRASVRLNKETIKEFKKRDILEKFLKFIHYTPLQEIPMILKFSKLTVVDKDKLHDVVVRDMEIEAFEKKVQIDLYTQEFCKLYKEILFYFFFVKRTRLYYVFLYKVYKILAKGIYTCLTKVELEKYCGHLNSIIYSRFDVKKFQKISQKKDTQDKNTRKENK